VVIDSTTIGYLCDVFILPEFRSRGYAAALMRHISDLLKGLRRIVVVTTDAHGLYRPYGFTALTYPER
jgi:GNAT superfamily N-acetyltransferase